MSNGRRAVINSGELEQWLSELRPSERSAVERALERDPHLRGEVGLLVEELPRALRDGFLRRFGPAVQGAERPSAAVMEGLRGAARAAVAKRRKSRRGTS